MLKDHSVAVVVTAYNEEKLIRKVLEGLPEWVDHIIVVDDSSKDKTAEIVRQCISEDSRIELESRSKNGGVGAAISAGYRASFEKGCDVTVVMNGDAQMDPEDMPALVLPIINDQADYTKGNRFFHGEAWELMPKHRYIGNAVLSLFTKVVSGYWHVADSQCGYTAISKKALEFLKHDRLFPRYGVPNDILIQLNIESMRVKDVPVRPIYNVGEVSGIRLTKVIPDISLLLLRRFFYRMLHKYVIRDFHPLVFFYMLGLTALPIGTSMGAYYFLYRLTVGPVTPVTALFAAFLTLTGLIFVLFAMLFDMENNRHLKG